jgi:hypothetical protein
MSEITGGAVGADERSRAPRSRSGVALAVAVWAICAAILASLIAGLNLLDIARYSPLLVFLAYGAWILFWSPSVVLTSSDLVVRNLLRTFTIPWASVTNIDTRMTLTIYTASRKIVAWAAPAPGRRRGVSSNAPQSLYSIGSMRRGSMPPLETGLAALSVRDYWEERSRSDRPGGGATPQQRVVRAWLVPETAILCGLFVVTIAALVLVHS